MKNKIAAALFLANALIWSATYPKQVEALELFSGQVVDSLVANTCIKIPADGSTFQAGCGSTNVGVGTASPLRALDVNGDAVVRGAFDVAGGSATFSGVVGAASQPRVRLRTANAQGCQSSGACSVFWDTEAEDIGGFWVVSSSDAITIPTGMGGGYLITGLVLYDASATAGVGRYAAIEVDGSATGYPSAIIPTVGSANATGVPISFFVTLTEGQVVRLRGRHDIGSGLNLLGGCQFSMVKVW